MYLPPKEEFLQKSTEALRAIHERLTDLKPIELDTLPPRSTALFIVDMLVGFTRVGPLAGPGMEALIPEIAAFAARCDVCGMEIVAFADCHPSDSPEFASYPPHCLRGDAQSEIVEEIRSACTYTRIEKNSTNGFVEPSFTAWMKAHPHIDTFIITGGCTDICVLQFALALKAGMNRETRKSRVIVPADWVATFDAGAHEAGLMDAVSLFLMEGSGVELCTRLR